MNRQRGNGYKTDGAMTKMYYTGINECYAGEHPFIKRDATVCRSHIHALLDMGFVHFVDLTESHELPPYRQWLSTHCQYQRFPIKNLSAPASMEDTLHLVESIMGCQGKTYIHCYGGVGRTGTIVACLLSACYKDFDYDSVMTRFQQVYAAYPKSAYMNAPETTAQRDFVKQFVLFCKKHAGMNS